MSGKTQFISAVCIFGTIGFFLHYINAPSELVVLCRGILGTATILLVMRLKKQSVDWVSIKRNLPLLILSGASLGLNWIFLFAAYRATTVAIASVCNYMAPIIIILLSPLILKERLDRRKMFCVACAFAGIALVSGIWNAGEGSFNARGMTLGLLAALGFTAVVFCNKKIHGVDSMDKSAVQLLISALVVLPYVLYRNLGMDLHFDSRSLMLILLLGIVHTGIAYILYFGGMGKISVQSVSILGYLEPIVSVLTSALLLFEPITVWGIIGTVMVIGASILSEFESSGKSTDYNS